MQDFNRNMGHFSRLCLTYSLGEKMVELTMPPALPTYDPAERRLLAASPR